MVLFYPEMHSHFTVLWSKLDRVGQKVIENLKIPLLIAPNVPEEIHLPTLFDLGLQFDLLQVGLGFDDVDCFEYHHGQVKVFFVELKHPIAYLSLVQHVIY